MIESGVRRDFLRRAKKFSAADLAKGARAGRMKGDGGAHARGVLLSTGSIQLNITLRWDRK